MSWSNRRPEVEGHYWLVEKQFLNGELVRMYDPNLVYITLRDNSNRIWMDMIGTDDPGGLPTTDELVIERTVPRDAIFGFDSNETALKKANDLVTRRWEYWIKPQRVPLFESEEVDEYPVLHQGGIMSIENELKAGAHVGDVGVQIAVDGRIWICYEGQAFIRFKPFTEKQIAAMTNTAKE
jgi:hypothetical protein